MLNDYVCYIHTDSCYFECYRWLKDNGITDDQWNKLNQKEKVEIIKEISEEVEKYINEKSFEETQKSHYNSQIDDFKITFEVEKIALSGLFKEKARYAIWTLLSDGKEKDEMSITGLEIIRSDSPAVVKPMIKEILKKILKNENDNIIREYINECKYKLKNCSPKEIAENKGINKLEKYITKDGWFKKGTPHQIKGVANIKRILQILEIENKYEIPSNSNKAKVVYVKRNKFGADSISFIEWPKEFDGLIQIDIDKMIYKNFIKKIEGLLEIVNKQHLINSQSLDLF